MRANCHPDETSFQPGLVEIDFCVALGNTLYTSYLMRSLDPGQANIHGATTLNIGPGYGYRGGRLCRLAKRPRRNGPPR